MSIIGTHRFGKGIDDCVPRQKDLLRLPALFQKIVHGLLCWRKMKIGKPRYRASVEFLGIRAGSVIGSEARLHVPYGYFPIKTSHRRGKGGGSVPVHQHKARLLCLQYPFHPLKNAHSDL